MSTESVDISDGSGARLLESHEDILLICVFLNFKLHICATGILYFSIAIYRFQARSFYNTIIAVQHSIDMVFIQGTWYALYFMKIEKTKYTIMR